MQMLFLSVLYLPWFTFGMDNGDKNVYGDPLEECCRNPVTGYFRNGYCSTGPTDHGRHIICSTMTNEFLEFTKTRGNDLSTPHPQFNFPGLKHGDCWCLCSLRWKEALDNGVAPPVNLRATHRNMLQYVSLEVLQQYSNSTQTQVNLNTSNGVNQGSKNEL